MASMVRTTMSESMDVSLDESGAKLVQSFGVVGAEADHEVRLELHITRQRMVNTAMVFNITTGARVQIDVLDAQRLLSELPGLPRVAEDRTCYRPCGPPLSSNL